MDYNETLLARKYAQAYINTFSTTLNVTTIEALEQARIFIEKNSTARFIGTLPRSFDRFKENLVERLVREYKLPQEFHTLGTLLIQHQRLFLLSHVLDYIVELYREQSHEVQALVRTSSPLTEEQKKHLVHFLSAKIGKKVIVKEYTDPTLIAGIRVEVDGMLWEYSIAKQLRDAQRTWRYA